jgi:hypothetical protein
MTTTKFIAVTLLAAATSAQALTLDFGVAGVPDICTSNVNGLGAMVPCGPGLAISQSYGDVAGVSDITYSSPLIATPTSLLWFGPNYNNLYGVAYASGSDANSLARIEIKPLTSGQAVTLSSFQLGAYANSTRSTTVNIYAIGSSAPLYSFSGDVGNGAVSATSFAPNITVTGGLWLEFKNSAFNVGIDNIQYSVSAVPEPASVLMMLAGVAGLLAARRRAP